MDSAISTAARALATGDPLQALRHVALRNDPPALALRGIALAQLGELVAARKLLRRAARDFGADEPVARARCVVAEAEVALAQRDLRGAARGLDDAIRVLERRRDLANAALARLIQARRAVWLGRLADADAALTRLATISASPRVVALTQLIRADLAIKRIRARDAAHALTIALAAARAARIPALIAEVEHAAARLTAPAARLVDHRGEHLLRLVDLEALFASPRLVLDLCRRELRRAGTVVSLVTRPLLLDLLAALAAQSDVPRDVLIARVFGARRSNESHRVRLRVEIGRLRRLIARHAEITATAEGYALTPRTGTLARVLPVEDGEASALWALLQGGEAWATSALAIALGKSQRAVQRALAELETTGKVRAIGDGRARRWVAVSGTGFATTLLLVAPGTLG